MKTLIQKAFDFLSPLSGKKLSRQERAEKAIALASFLIEEKKRETTKKERKREYRLANMIQDPKGKVFMTLMADQCFRSASVERTADQILFLIKKFGIPHFLNETERMKFLVFQIFGNYYPRFFVPFIKKKIKEEMSHVLLPEGKLREKYFQTCFDENIRINLNHLGEAILGEEESQKRLNIYIQDLKNPQIEYISVKISTIFSQINVIGWDYSLNILAERLRSLYRVAKSHFFIRPNGEKVEKFVNLDMEEYRDLPLTVALFQKVLNDDEFFHFKAGIVLQSYIPDSFIMQQKLTDWAKDRVSRGGAPIKIRIVKGANFAMETVESSIKGWPKPTFDKKSETDALFKRMLEFACSKENISAVHIGVGSHNLFDICYALILKAENELNDQIIIEMLQGMADSLRKVVQKVTQEILLYCPEAKEKDFHNAVAYLIRRLDENSGPENFLRHIFAIAPESSEWEDQEGRFLQAIEIIDSLHFLPKRTQNRTLPPPPADYSESFKNEADTDFSLEENRIWASEILKNWKTKIHSPIPLVIEGQEIHAALQNGIDPSKPFESLYSYSLADFSLANQAIQCAKAYEKEWSALPFNEKSLLLGKTAQLFRIQRGELIGAMMADTGKNIWEADPEVSEAIDFLEYYRKNWDKFLSLKDVTFTPKGTFLVAPPWNFSCSIATGLIAAALTAGNCVIFKPAPEAVLVGWTLIKLFWEAGIPKNALQFINCDDDSVGSFLVKHPQLNGVLLTGATETAKKLLRLRPGLDLNAETGGKNALIVTAMSDRDLAVRDIVSSAFSYSGQKCSACSLAILEAEVYDDPHFMRQLKDAAESLAVGSIWNPSTKIGPLIRPPQDPLKRALNSLEPGESWLLMPKNHQENPHLWSPGIKKGVHPGSFGHKTEFFGPLLGLMRAKDLNTAIEYANATPYGLTAGLHSLDEREQQRWKKKIIAGNLYINRGITGAIVRRQPFGGCKDSSFGPEAKAGGPNYVLYLTKISQSSEPQEKAPLPESVLPILALIKSLNLTEEEMTIWKKSAESYAYWAAILKEPSDFSCIMGQDNDFFHVSRDKAYLRMTENKKLSLLQICTACLICQTPLEISSEDSFFQTSKIPGIEWIQESEKSFLDRIKRTRVRVIGNLSDEMLKKASEIGAILQNGPVLANGRIELLYYLREVSVSFDYHRYGYLGLRDPSFSKS